MERFIRRRPLCGSAKLHRGCPRGWVSKSAEGRIAALSAESTKNTKTLLAARKSGWNEKTRDSPPSENHSKLGLATTSHLPILNN